MREICPSCGKDMIVTTEAFEINGDAVRGIPHLLCRSCGKGRDRRPLRVRPLRRALRGHQVR